MNKLSLLILLILFACNSTQPVAKETVEIKVEPKISSAEDIQFEKDELEEMEEVTPPKVKIFGADFNSDPITSPMINFEDREVVFKPPMDLKPTQAGVVTIEICINKDGNVQSTSIDKSKTTITNKNILEYFLERGKKYKFSSSAFAPDLHCGFLDFEIVEEK